MPAIGTGVSTVKGGGQSWSSYWATLISAVVENDNPNKLILTFPKARTVQVSDFGITGITAGITIQSLAWVGAVLTLTLSGNVVYGDSPIVSFKTTNTHAVTNNVTATTELTTYITGLTTPLSSEQRRRLNTFVKNIVTRAGVSNLTDLVDTMWVRIGETSESCLKNLAKDAHHSALAGTPAPVFTALGGFTPNGTTGYLDLNFNPNDDGVNFTQNSASQGVYVMNDVNMGAGTILGVREGAGSKRTMLYPRTSNVFGSFLNTDSTDAVNGVACVNSKGSFIGNRSASNAQQMYAGSVLVKTNTTVSSGRPDFESVENGLNSAGSVIGLTTWIPGLSFYGKSLTGKQVSIIFSEFIEYLIDAGVNFETCYVYDVSPVLSEIQGYTTDGTYHYGFDTASIKKRNNDATWSVAVQNATPLDGLTINHIGDGQYYNGKLYTVGMNYVDAENISEQSIMIYSAIDCSRVSVNDISAQGGNPAGCCINANDGDNGIIYVVYFNDTTHINMYDLLDFSYLGQITLSSPIAGMQGITEKNGYWYISSHSTTESIYKCLKDGSSVVKINERTGFENEGIDYSGEFIKLGVYRGTGTVTDVYLLKEVV